LSTGLSAGLDVRASTTGTELAFEVVGGQAGSARVAECTWSKPSQFSVLANCDADFNIGVEDVAFWMLP
jgi:hypothetical protein